VISGNGAVLSKQKPKPKIKTWQQANAKLYVNHVLFLHFYCIIFYILLLLDNFFDILFIHFLNRLHYIQHFHVVTLCLMFNVIHQLHKSTFLVCKN